MPAGTIFTCDSSSWEMVVCPECGVHYFITAAETTRAKYLRDHTAIKRRDFYCPEGHKWHFLNAQENVAAAKRLERDRAVLQGGIEAMSLGEDIVSVMMRKGE